MVCLFVNFAINSNAICCVNIERASCTEGINKSTIFELVLISNRQYSIIDLSEITPNALIRINKGIGFFTLGISTTS